MSDFIRRKIKSTPLGQTLKQARTKKELSLEQVEEETKVRTKYLEALENERYDILPGNVYALGFLAKYLDFLELANKNELMTQFKMERSDIKNDEQILPTRQKMETKFSVTPKILTILAGILVFLTILGYIGYSVRAFTLPPNLEISSPSSEQIIKENQVNIVGKTDEGSTLMINNQSVLLDANGNFSQQVKLNPGLNTFEVKATNRLKKETIKEIKILAQF